ncbi:MAG: nucleotidyl transferase AbiEii/AbiGii toxin family protein [Thermoplasmatota archaeon]
MAVWDDIVTAGRSSDQPLHHVFQEHLQKTVLTALNRAEAFTDIVFQGGTALRLFYGNPRFSEDLDFVLSEGHTFNLTGQASPIQTFVTDTYPFLDECSITIQKDTRELQRLVLTTQGDNPEQRRRVHIELAHVPSYMATPRILDHPPYNPAVQVEQPEEILADKLAALALRSYLKGRDLWDIYFLTREKNIDIRWNLVKTKISDYNGDPERLPAASKTVQNEGAQALADELARFLPPRLHEQYRSRFDGIAAHVAAVAAAARDAVEENADEG